MEKETNPYIDLYENMQTVQKYRETKDPSVLDPNVDYSELMPEIENGADNPYIQDFEKRQTTQNDIKAPNRKIFESIQNATNLNDKALASVLGAGTGFVTGPIIQRVVDSQIPKQAQKSRTYYNPTGRSVEDSIENRRMYMDAQHEQDKGIRRNTTLAKRYPNFTRTPMPERELSILRKAMQPFKVIGNYAENISDAAGKAAGPRIGGALGLGGAALGSTETYNRIQQGDYVGAGIAGLGALGSVASMAPAATPLTAIIKGLGIGAQAISPLGLMAYDYYKNKKTD
jgi:hypothetical protein